MIVSSAINLALFSMLGLLMILFDKPPAPWAFAILCPMVVAMFQYRAVWPRARAVPIGARTGYHAYGSANAGTWMMVVDLLVTVLFRLVT